MDWKLELAVVHVSDVDRAETFKIKQAGFDLHVDHRAATDTMSASSGSARATGEALSSPGEDR